jgi:hypothetical protein
VHFKIEARNPVNYSPHTNIRLLITEIRNTPGFLNQLFEIPLVSWDLLGYPEIKMFMELDLVFMRTSIPKI